ncbi:hypothetical protein LSCM1_02535 [Leishmania martiniquensis]|uniref:SET domain-containing protein n=1 Tax=Leishmania martiniquensis TaxID=1580590 RepID=A0A836GPE1_9TRYP|nr:hypothetical protein LSCM1_02535 [Leishmania martiniquensis]
MPRRDAVSPSEARLPGDEPLVPPSAMMMSLLSSLSAVPGVLCVSSAPPQTPLFSRKVTPCTGGEGLPVYASVTYRRLCCLVLFLCRWVAERVAIPSGGELSAVLRHIPSARLVGGPSRSWLETRDGVDDDDEEGRGGIHCSTAALADCRLSTLLPAPPPQLTRATIEAVLEVNANGIQGDDESHIDVVLWHLCAASSRPGADANVCDDAMRGAIISLRDTWRQAKRRIFLEATPSARLTDGYISALLYMYAEAGVELASCTLLRTLTPATEPMAAAETEVTAAVAALDAVHELLAAQQVARIATSHTAPMPAGKLILSRIRTLLLALLSASPLSSSYIEFHLHAHVELSSDPSRTVAGLGLVATDPIGEGELLVREAALSTLTDTGVEWFSQGGAKATSTATTAEECFKDSTPIQGEGARCFHENPATASVTEEAAAASSVQARQRGDSALLMPEKGDRGAAAQLLCALACFPNLLCRGWQQWAAHVMGDALALRSTSRVPHWQVGAADNTQERAAPESSPSALCSTAGAPPRRALSWQEGAAHASLPPALQLLLDVRGIDEFRIDPPPRLCRHTQCDDHRGCVNPGPRRSAGGCGVGAGPFPTSNDVSTKALFPFLRHLNHACVPNTILVLERTPVRRNGGGEDGVVASLVALRAIESGEEITVSYVPATTALTVSKTELSEVLGFQCHCYLCTQKAALLHGQVCGDCGQLIYEPGSQGEPAPPSGIHTTAGASRRTTVFRHEEQCPQRRGTGEARGAVDRKSSLVAELQLQLDGISVQLAEGQGEDEAIKNARDPVAAAVRHLVDLDMFVAQTLLPTHYLRLRLRLEVFAYSTMARGLGSTVSAELIHLCSSTLEGLEMLLPPNHPLLTGLRMYLVFSRGRHVRAVNAATDVSQGTKHAGCCGAVREQAALMQLPFVLDPLVRRCVARCFQEHFLQLLGWRADWLSRAGEAGALGSFLARYPVELEACGVTTTEHMELLSCLEDGTEEV